MKKILILLAAAAVPFVCNAQEIGLSENYKTKKEKRLAKFTPHKSGDLTLQAGLSTVTNLGLNFNFGAEYMLSERLGVRTSYTTNNLSAFSRWGGYNRATLDLTYHFIQSNRWDVYAFAGLGAERFRFRWSRNSNESLKYTRPFINGGVGARYRITPSFGIQAEVGKATNFSVFKKFNFSKR